MKLFSRKAVVAAASAFTLATTTITAAPAHAQDTPEITVGISAILAMILGSLLATSAVLTLHTPIYGMLKKMGHC